MRLRSELDGRPGYALTGVTPTLILKLQTLLPAEGLVHDRLRRTVVRLAPLALASLLLPPTRRASGQSDPSALTHGRDYLFNRAYAERKVADDIDHATIRLNCYVWRPIGQDPAGVVVFSHDSTGGNLSEREPNAGMPRGLLTVL